MKLAIHLIPCDGIGGVESAFRSIPSNPCKEFLFEKASIASLPSQSVSPKLDYCGPYVSVNDPRNFLRLMYWLSQRKPQLLIVSLWRCYAFSLLYKFLHPRCKIVCFLHCDHPVHLLDSLFARIAMTLASAIWADSCSTLCARVPLRFRPKARIISLVLQSYQPCNSSQPSPAFIFWGRLAAQKSLHHALFLISYLRPLFPEVTFSVVGPDCGQLKRLQKVVDLLDLCNVVKFLGPKSHSEIISLASVSSFFLQTSLYEGMSVSVVEAMQLGLVPVVTPVGEVSKYCIDDYNSVLIPSTGSASVVQRIKHLLDSQADYMLLRERAISRWSSVPLYRHDVSSSCADLLGAPCRVADGVDIT